MIKEQILGVIVLISTVIAPLTQGVRPLLSPAPEIQEEVLAEHFMDLNTRAAGEYVNDVFKFNILLAVEKFGHSFTLEPGEGFAFHENMAPEFADLAMKTGFTRYTAKEGYQTVLGLPGNGVCHLATLMNWVASDVGLEVTARVNHNFAPVPEIPREYGTSIRYMADGSRNTQNQNLYIINNFDFPVEFVFETAEDEISLKILKEGDNEYGD